MKKEYGIKAAADAAILLCSLILCRIVYLCYWPPFWSAAIFSVFVVSAAFALADGIWQGRQIQKRETESLTQGQGNRLQAIDRLILLDEQDKPIKSWDMAGRISMLIGREGGEEDVDVDLEDCAFSSFIDFEHAVLNFCLDQWYVEDLASQNGVKIRKAEDGECYKVMGRPCRVQAGDVLYIANTKLLLS